MDYLKHFGLDREPFGNDPMPGFHFDSPLLAGAERRLLRGPLQAKGLTVLIGDHGSGKTTLLRRLVELLPENRFDAAVMVMAGRPAEPVEFLQRFARLFGVTAPSEDRSTLLGQLAGRLVQIQERGLHAVAVIDEAQLLDGSEVLAELRGLLNLEADKGRTLSLVLSGLPAFDDRLAATPSLSSRVDVKVQLEAFDAETTARYLAERLAFARGKPEILQPAAVAAIHAASGGILRRVNTLADNALYEAFLAGGLAISAQDVERAARSLRLVPSGPLEAAEAVVAPIVGEPEYATPVASADPLR
ncbi:MAG: AAA family ATPase [Myxococcales bacterium]|nr:AAA family ATPase [Myxococcales bacterium]